MSDLPEFRDDHLAIAVRHEPPRPRGDRPNVIVFFTDQQRWDTTGLHGNPLDLTPNFDEAALRGTHVTHSFTVQPVCGPARACMQTGQYATRNGCHRNGIPRPEDVPTLAHRFGEAGYLTGYIGKWHLASQERVPEDQRGGYERWLAANKLEFTSDAYDTVLFDEHRDPVRLPGYRIDAVTDAGIDFIAENRERPFFLFLSHLEPHHQNHIDGYPAPRGYRRRYEGRWIPPDLAALGGSTHQHIAGYYGMVKRLDEAFGRMLDALTSLGLLDDTIVLFTSDHGNHFKTRNDEYKRSGHEASLRVPTLFLGPGFDGGRQVRELVSLLDLSATLLDAAGLPVPDELQGRSILPLLGSGDDDWRDEIFFQVSESEVGRGLRTRRWKYGVVALDADPWNDPSADTYVESYLYDLEHDPHELFDLVGQESHRELAAVLRERLKARMVEAGEPEPRIEAARPKPRYEQRQVMEGEEEE